MSAPPDTAAKMAIGVSPARKKSTPNRMQAMMQNPEESPFTPSMRLIALMIPVAAKTVSGMAAQTGICPMPHNVWKSSILYPPTNISSRITMISTRNRNAGDRLSISSIVPV